MKKISAQDSRQVKISFFFKNPLLYNLKVFLERNDIAYSVQQGGIFNAEKDQIWTLSDSLVETDT